MVVVVIQVSNTRHLVVLVVVDRGRYQLEKLEPLVHRLANRGIPEPMDLVTGVATVAVIAMLVVVVVVVQAV